MEEMMEGEVFDEQDFTQADLVASQHFGSKSGQDDSVKQKASIMEEIEGESEDSCDEVFTQEFTEEGVTQYLETEQKIAEQQMEVFKEQQRLMSESLQLRLKILSKKIKKVKKWVNYCYDISWLFYLFHFQMNQFEK